MTPVARAYQSFTASTVRVSRPVGTPVDPSAWERRDRFVRGGPRLAKGDDQVIRTAKPLLVGDDAVWERLQKTFQKHPDAAYRAYFAAETLRALPRRQRERLRREFYQMHPALIPLFLINTWAPPLEALAGEIGQTARAFMRTLIEDFHTIFVAPPKKARQAGRSPMTKPEAEAHPAELTNLAKALKEAAGQGERHR